ncbi:MAG: hypothetical protein ACLRVT_02170 [Oscillospiraceae bacterium]
MKLSSSIEAVQRSLDKQLHTEENFDIVKRRVVIWWRDAVPILSTDLSRTRF